MVNRSSVYHNRDCTYICFDALLSEIYRVILLECKDETVNFYRISVIALFFSFRFSTFAN